MTEQRFEYSEILLEACAKSIPASFERTTVPEDDGKDRDNLTIFDESCEDLFAQHVLHYEGREMHFSHDEKNLRTYPTAIRMRLENFVRNVAFVYQHNTNNDGEHHKVALNRFASDNLTEVLGGNGFSEQHRWLREAEGEKDDDGDYDFSDDFFLDEFAALFQEGVVTTLSEDTIASVAANLTIGRGSFNKLNPPVYHKKRLYQELSDTYVDVPMTPEQSPFQAPETDLSQTDGSLLSVKRNPEYHKRRHRNDKWAVHDANPENDDFSKYLNWATTNNPDGVPLVHEAFDQGNCGSCWAFAATGSLEASAARREAYMSYNDYLENHFTTINNYSALVDVAVANAQQIETNAFTMLNLSVQELVDCDSAADQGCTGGNPLLAFYFIHRFGLTTWERYPYSGFQDTCRKQFVRHPVASAKSWGVVSPNHENHMELTLRFVGPIAVGINGAEPSFLAYSGGIFNKTKCKQGANHALLIVGYGEEINADGELLRYWICRNSWGKGWGENGFVRIARQQHGSKGIPGVCGVARSPSVALGGFLLEQEGLSVLGSWAHKREGTVEQFEYSPMENVCSFLRLKLDGKCGRLAAWIDGHHALLVGMFGVLLGLVALWPLSRDWRRRRRRRRERRRRSSSAGSANSNNKKETSPLLSPEGNGVTYGSNAEEKE